ncbi:MAG: thiol reductant ABC exporter subunit CydD [Actinomycetales bacterium]
MKFIDPRLFRQSRSSRGLIFLAVVSAILITVFTLSQSYLLANLISAAFLKKESYSDLDNLIYFLVGIMSGRVILNYFGERVTNQISHRIRIDLRGQLFEKILKNGSLLNLRYGPGKLSLIATKAISNLEPYFTRFVPQLFVASLVPIVVGITIAYLDLISGLIVLFTVPLIPFFGALIGKFTSEAMAKRWRTMGILSGYLLDLLSGLTTLKLYGRAEVQEGHISEIGNRYRKETMRVLRISFLTSLALELIATLSVALIAVTIGLRLVNGDFELWRGLMILILAPEVYWPIRNLSAQFHASADGMESAKEIFEILDIKVAPDDGIKAPNNVSKISWQGLTVEYSDREVVALPSGAAKAGELTLLTGPSGSGKSTFLNLLLRIIEPSTGEIRVDEVLLSQIKRSDWLSNIAWVPQEPQFPRVDIRGLFRMSSSEATDMQISQALSDVGLANLPLSNSLALSIGQQRRLALARALLRNSQILIMDEPSAPLDDESEMKIIEILKNAAKSGKIVIVVSHREALFSIADSKIDFAGVLA